MTIRSDTEDGYFQPSNNLVVKAATLATNYQVKRKVLREEIASVGWDSSTGPEYSRSFPMRQDFVGVLFLQFLGFPWVHCDWIEIKPPILIDYCPQSPISYDCSSYQRDIWNSPSLAYTPPHPAISSGSSFSSMIPPKSQQQYHDICVVFLPGTGGNASNFHKGFLSSLSLRNYHVISLSYLSTSYSVSQMNYLCGDRSLNGNVDTNTCLHELHSSVVHGTQFSSIWGIHASDSISYRLLLTIQELNKLDISWSTFLNVSSDGVVSLNWERIVISGHSQGAGHAGYLAATTRTYGALMISGIQDCCSYSIFVNSNIYSWKTPLSRLSILYHGHEDLRGIIEANTAQLLPGISPIEFISNSILLPNQMQSTSKYYYVKISPQESCSSSRPEHSSTALDDCSPLDSSQVTGYLYQSLWQYLVSFA